MSLSQALPPFVVLISQLNIQARALAVCQSKKNLIPKLAEDEEPRLVNSGDTDFSVERFK